MPPDIPRNSLTSNGRLPVIPNTGAVDRPLGDLLHIASIVGSEYCAIVKLNARIRRGIVQ
jgi:hypothetical protein